VPHRDKVIVFENRQWTVAALPKDFGIKITPVQLSDGKEEMLLYCGDRETQEVWLGRLKKVCMNEATHGIEIQSHTIDNDITREYFRKCILAGKDIGESGKVDVSVWDFAGQHDYYNNHHYFISTRTVFLVLWKMSEGEEKGMRGLEFWFSSLASHLGVTSSVSSSSYGSDSNLAPQAAASMNGAYYSIIVVGTFLDHPSVKRGEKPIRQRKIQGIAKECGLRSSSSLQYYEVSCSSSLENIDVVHGVIVRTMLSHSYMGERVPKSYLQLGTILRRLRKQETLPLVPLGELDKDISSIDVVKRALGLLSLWGECVYFDSPPELSDIVILDPRFLAKGILADLFSSNPTVQSMKKDGVVRHVDLHHIWKRFKREGMTGEEFSSLCSTFLTLLQTLGVCFVMEEDRSKPFI